MKNILWGLVVFFMATFVFSDKLDAGNKWYEGGTLHGKNALSWQRAKFDNKLATSADFIANLWMTKSFGPTIQNKINSIEDIQPYAKNLVRCVDNATKKEKDPQANESIFVNQKVSSISAICMQLMGWFQ